MLCGKFKNSKLDLKKVHTFVVKQSLIIKKQLNGIIKVMDANVNVADVNLKVL